MSIDYKNSKKVLKLRKTQLKQIMQQITIFKATSLI